MGGHFSYKKILLSSQGALSCGRLSLLDGLIIVNYRGIHRLDLIIQLPVRIFDRQCAVGLELTLFQLRLIISVGAVSYPRRERGFLRSRHGPRSFDSLALLMILRKIGGLLAHVGHGVRHLRILIRNHFLIRASLPPLEGFDP